MFRTKFWLWLARCLPRRLQYWATIVLAADYTASDKGRHRTVPDITVVECLEHFGTAPKRRSDEG